MNVANWLTIIVLVAGAVGVILRSQSNLITRLLANEWNTMKERQDWLEERQDDAEKDQHEIDTRLSMVEKACSIRHGITP